MGFVQGLGCQYSNIPYDRSRHSFSSGANIDAHHEAEFQSVGMTVNHNGRTRSLPGFTPVQALSCGIRLCHAANLALIRATSLADFTSDVYRKAFTNRPVVDQPTSANVQHGAVG